MDIRTLGIELTPCRQILPAKIWDLTVAHGAEQISALRAHLKDPQANPPPKLIGGRLICGTEARNYYTGVCMKIRSIRSIFKLTSFEEVFEVAPEHVPEHQRVVELNYFVLHKKYFRGLYFHYHGSTTFPDFQYVWSVIHNRETRRMLAELKKRHKAKEIDDHEYASVLKDLDSGLAGAMMPDRRGIPDLVADLDTVQSVAVEFVEFEPPNALLSALSPYARRKRVYLSMEEDTPGTRIGRLIDGQLNNVSHLRVHGYDSDEYAHTYTLEDNAVSFGQIDYDKASPWMRIDLSDVDGSISGSTIIKNLIKLAEKAEVAAKIQAHTRDRTWLG